MNTKLLVMSRPPQDRYCGCGARVQCQDKTTSVFKGFSIKKPPASMRLLVTRGGSTGKAKSLCGRVWHARRSYISRRMCEIFPQRGLFELCVRSLRKKKTSPDKTITGIMTITKVPVHALRKLGGAYREKFCVPYVKNKPDRKGRGIAGY